MIRKLIGSTLAGTALAVALVGPVAAQNQAGDSLVNVQVSDLTVLVPISLAANLCDINVNILAQQERNGGAACTADAESIASPGSNGGGGGGNQAGDSLVNVQLSNIDVFVPIGVAANLCDINANVLAEQVRDGGAQCDATAESIASRGGAAG
jgi:hypothetical protein